MECKSAAKGAAGEDKLMAYRNEAYDFSFFEEHVDNTAPVLDPKVQEQPRHNVVELPEQPKQPGQRPRRQPKPKRGLLRRAVAALSFAAIFATGISAVQSEVQLTELTEEINKTQNMLAEAESLEIQLSMQAAQKMTDAQIEEYAVQQLGMSKMTGSQVTYLHVAQQDKGTVVQDIEGASPLEQLWAKIRSWLAR